MKNKRYLLTGIALLLGVQMACIKQADVTSQPVADSRPLLAILKNNFNFSMFYGAVQRVGLDKTLDGAGPFTVLVPDNNAFQASGISADSLARIDTASLKKLLRYHIIPQSLPFKALPQAIDFTFNTLAGPPVYFSQPLPIPYQNQAVNKGIVHINGVNVNTVDIAASNGYIIALSKVLYYPETSVKSYLERSPQYSYLVQAMKQFGLFDQLDKPGPFVVMAPSNEMFIKNGIDKAALTGLDSLTYKKMLFNAYILYQQRFFITDLIDAPISAGLGASPGIITPEFVQVIKGNANGNIASFSIWPLNFSFIQSTYAPPYYGDANIYAPPARLVNSDHQAANGVVHGIGGLAMLPDSAKIHP